MNENNINSDENSDLQRFCQAMAILRQKIDTLLKSTPKLLAISSLEELPADKRGTIEDQLWDIFVYGKYYVERIKSNLSREPIISASEAGKGHFKYHQKRYKPFIQKIKGLIDVSNAPERREVEINFIDSTFGYFCAVWEGEITENEIDECFSSESIDDCLSVYEEYAASGQLEKYIKAYIENHVDGDNPDSDGNIKNRFEAMLEIVLNYRNDITEAGVPAINKWNGIEEEDTNERRAYDLSVSDCEMVIKKPYFKPDDWIANENELSPVIVNRKRKNIPQKIQKRIHEIHRSFIFGHWMSVIAMSRCLLEYAIIDRKSLLEKQLGRNVTVRNDKGYTISLRDLVPIAYEAFPKLGEDMDFIVEQGNYILHDTKVKPIRSPMDTAKKCVDGITKIISTLYSTQNNRESL